MNAKKKAKQSIQPKIEDPKALRVELPETETRAAALAHTSLRPTVQAALTLMEYNKAFGEMSLNTLVTDLVAQCALANDGNLSRAEAVLTTQAHTLDAIFNNLARRAALNAGEYMNACETYLRIALKAQSQCRATLETLAAIKNPPPVAFVRQANIAHGPQQVNNGTAQPFDSSRAQENEKQRNKLLEKTDGERLDFGTASAASDNDPALEPVGAIDRSHDARGETQGQPKRI